MYNAAGLRGVDRRRRVLCKSIVVWTCGAPCVTGSQQTPAGCLRLSPVGGG